MSTQVLVPMDDSEMAERALEYALEVHSDADVTVLHVAGAPSPMMGKAMSLVFEDDLEDAARDHASTIFERAEEIAAGHGREIRTAVAFGSPARAIVNEADDYDTVVLGSHSGTLAERLVVGNVAETVFERSPVPVTVVR